MPYAPYEGGTLLIPTGPDLHLFGIITPRCGDGCHLIVNFSSVRAGAQYDPACVIEAGEHEAINHRSYAVYRMADIQRADRLGRMVDGWVYRRGEHNLSEALLKRLQDGAIETRHAPQRIKRYAMAVLG